MQGAVLGTRDLPMNKKTRFVPSWGLYLSRERQKKASKEIIEYNHFSEGNKHGDMIESNGGW